MDYDIHKMMLDEVCVERDLLRRALEKACEELANAKPHLSTDVKWWVQLYKELAED